MHSRSSTGATLEERSAPPTTEHAAVGPGPHRSTANIELIVGGFLVVVTAIGGGYFAGHPLASAFDNLVPVPVTKGSWLTGVVDLRSPVVVVVASVVLAVLASFRDRLRAVTCLVGPPLALLLGEAVVKPLVGRTIGGAFSYPSGSTVGAAALALAVTLAVPRRWRPVTGVLAALYSLWMAVSVIALQWHYPTDAIAGLCFGPGIVLLVDGVVLGGRHWWTTAFRRT